MDTSLRIATFNLENLDDLPNQQPTLADRMAVLRPHLLRLRADILCLQEVNGQEQSGAKRDLRALDALLADTPYATFHRRSTTVADGSQVFNERNLVILSRFPIVDHRQLKHDLAPAPRYQTVTANPPETAADAITWERPLLHAQIQLTPTKLLHVINVHLKSKLPTPIAGQMINFHTWRTVSGWAEGFFLSSMKRVGQALELRMLIDALFDADPGALIAVCGDFNAERDEVPIEAICGYVENTGNAALTGRVLVACELTIPESSRYSLLHRGKGRMLDHVLVSRPLIASYRGSEIHNELLHDESIAFASDVMFPESDHAPVVATFGLPE